MTREERVMAGINTVENHQGKSGTETFFRYGERGGRCEQQYEAHRSAGHFLLQRLNVTDVLTF